MLIAIGAKPMAGGIVPFILEAHGNMIFVKRPKLLDEAIVEFASPLPGKEFDDGRAPMEKFRAVPPPAVFRIGKRHPGGIAAIPGILGKANFIYRCRKREGRQRRAARHRLFPFVATGQCTGIKAQIAG